MGSRPPRPRCSSIEVIEKMRNADSICEAGAFACQSGWLSKLLPADVAHALSVPRRHSCRRFSVAALLPQLQWQLKVYFLASLRLLPAAYGQTRFRALRIRTQAVVP